MSGQLNLHHEIYLSAFAGRLSVRSVAVALSTGRRFSAGDIMRWESNTEQYRTIIFTQTVSMTTDLLKTNPIHHHLHHHHLQVLLQMFWVSQSSSIPVSANQQSLIKQIAAGWNTLKSRSLWLTLAKAEESFPEPSKAEMKSRRNSILTRLCRKVRTPIPGKAWETDGRVAAARSSRRRVSRTHLSTASRWNGPSALRAEKLSGTTATPEETPESVQQCVSWHLRNL